MCHRHIFLTLRGFDHRLPDGSGNEGCPLPPSKTAVPGGTAVLLGGSGWIRTTEVVDNRFTVCPLWPLGNAPIFTYLLEKGVGAGRRTRTPDLLITNQLLYQLSYTSTISSEVYVTRNVPICQPLNLFFWRFFILRIVRKRWRDLQRAWPAGLCPRCGMELYPGDLDWVLGGRRLCGACAAAWLAEEAERLAAGRKGAVE